ncbi:MAG: hypothetical protein R2861_16290 [Desulfobacterales bacterium]
MYWLAGERKPTHRIPFFDPTACGGVVITTVVTASGIAIGLQFHFSRAMAIDSAASRYRHMAAMTNEYQTIVATGNYSCFV